MAAIGLKFWETCAARAEGVGTPTPRVPASTRGRENPHAARI